LDKTIVTTLLIVAGVVCAVLVFNTIYPAAVQSGDALTSRQRRIDERLKSQIEIIHATGNGSNALVWVKNVGSSSIGAVKRCDVFFGPENDFSRIPHEDEAAGTPYWEGEVTNDTDWKPTATLQITITYGSVLSGRYFVKVVTPNGLSDECYFSE